MEYGASSIFLRDMEMIIRVQMLMYGKEASNRKQEIDRQHHIIPNQKPKDKHYGKIKTFGFFHKSKLRRNPNFLQKRLQIRIFTAKKFGFYF